MGEQKRRQHSLHSQQVNRLTTRTVESHCLSCGEIMTAATAAGHKKIPKEGAIGICLYCNHIMIYDAQLKLRDLNDEEMIEIAGNPEILRIMRIKAKADEMWKKKKSLQKNEYLCESCGNIYEKGWSDQEAMAEKNTIFPDAPMSECGIVCEPCFQKISSYFGINPNRRAPRVDN